MGYWQKINERSGFVEYTFINIFDNDNVIKLDSRHCRKEIDGFMVGDVKELFNYIMHKERREKYTWESE